MNASLQLFICYRRSDGFQTAKWIHTQLNTAPLKVGDDVPTLDVYLDSETPAVGDWTQVHKPYLETAAALIFIATPGGRTRLPGTDWVHDELDWWLANRKIPPIVIDAKGEGDRWIPETVLNRWPKIHRLEFVYEHWVSLSHPLREEEHQRIIGLLHKSLVESTPKVLLQQAQHMASLSRRARVTATLLLLILISAVATGIFLRDRATKAELENASLHAVASRLEEELSSGRLKVDKREKPVVVTLSDADGSSFLASSAEISPRFEDNLNSTIIPTLENASAREGADTIEIIGHTDGTPMAGRVSNLDRMNPTLMTDFTQIIPASNVELGLLRAFAVAKVLEQSRLTGRLRAIRYIRCYSAGSFVAPQSTASPHLNDPFRRRIEIRLSKS